MRARSCSFAPLNNYSAAGVGVGVPASSGRFGRRLFALSSADSGTEPGAAFGFIADGGVTGTLGATRGSIRRVFGVGVAAALSAGAGVTAGAGGVARGGAAGR